MKIFVFWRLFSDVFLRFSRRFLLPKASPLCHCSLHCHFTSSACFPLVSFSSFSFRCFLRHVNCSCCCSIEGRCRFKWCCCVGARFKRRKNHNQRQSYWYEMINSQPFNSKVSCVEASPPLLTLYNSIESLSDEFLVVNAVSV